MAFFMEECHNAYHGWSTRALPRSTTTEKQNRKLLKKNATSCEDSLENVQHIEDATILDKTSKQVSQSD